MNEHELAKKIVRVLNQDMANLDPKASARLKSARDAAMTQYRAHQTVQNMTLANHGSFFNESRDWIAHHRLWLPIAALIIGLIAIAYSQTNLQGDELADVDASILSSDLPVDAYVDHRLSTWLESSKQ